MTYVAPLVEQMFVLRHVARAPELGGLPLFAHVTDDLVEAVLSEGGKLAAEVFAPLNRIGDAQGATWSPEGVTLPAGFAEAYAAFATNGWNSLAAAPDHGGQGLPFVVASAVQEQIASANMAFSLCMMLSQSAIAALQIYGSEEQKRLYLARLVSGEWTGTMNLTEPQSGSDLSTIRASATPAGKDGYLVSGTKIFITWGEHDLAPNIVHMVLARLPGAPPGTKGISLFLVPKFLPAADGTPGRRNDLRCSSIEHKLGIHASPTCTMRFGDEGGCVGWLVGEEHGGMRAMFTMMNHARIGVGLQGVAIAERAYQAAVAYARERVQGAAAGGGGGAGPIVDHPDVRRMLMTMRALTEAARALAYYTAAAADRAHAAVDEASRREAQGLADLLTPITKAWATDIGVEVAGLGIQVFGGTGYIEEAGAAQHLRDARIAPIYEGTNGIQAADLVGRKLRLDNGAPMERLVAEMRATVERLAGDPRFASMAHCFGVAVTALRNATETILSRDPRDAAAASTPFLRIAGFVIGGWLLVIQAQAAAADMAQGEGDAPFLAAKIATAGFFLEQLLPQIYGLMPAAAADADALFAISGDQLSR